MAKLLFKERRLKRQGERKIIVFLKLLKIWKIIKIKFMKDQN